MSVIQHVGCGGTVLDDLSKRYEHEGGALPAQRCVLCGVEVLDDTEVVVVNEVTGEEVDV